MPDIDWGALVGQATEQAGKPLEATPAAFSATYGPVADAVSAKTGIDSNTLIGQWGHETGWGKSIVPGTNNLGNIKATKASGPGVSAKDNMTGSVDGYQKFDTPEAFGDAYANLISSRYKDAMHTGTDVAATANALKAGGYAEDPNYVSKLTAATATAQKARGGGGTNWGSLVASAVNSQPSQAAPANATQAMLQQYPGFGNQPESGSTIGGFAGGVGEGVGKTILGAQALVGKGLQAAGFDQAGQAVVEDAQTGAANLGAQAGEAAGSHTTARTVGNITGAVAPALLVGPEVLPQVALGAGYGATGAALNNQPILPATVEGAGLGAGGAVAGKLLGAGGAAAAPVLKRVFNSATGGENAAAAQIAGKVGGGNLDSTIANLRANSDEIIPGSLPTSADAAQNEAITGLQRRYANTPAGQEAFPARQTANTEARINAGQAVVGQNIDAEAQAFTQQQAQRVAAGQTELPAVSDAQNRVMQTPAYVSAINDARTVARNAGVSTFDDATGTIRANIADELHNVTGTQQELEAARLARSQQARQNYGAIGGEVPLVGGAAEDVLARPGVRSAITEAAANDQTRLGLRAPEGITTVKPKVVPVVDATGVTTGFKQVAPGYQTASAQTLVGAKGILSDAATGLSTAGKPNASDIQRQAMNALHDYLTDNVPAYRAANDAYRDASIPIDQMTAMQKRLVAAVDPMTGEVKPAVLKQALASLQREQIKTGTQQADRVTTAQMNQLTQVAQKAADSVNNVTGVSGQGQEYLRQALEANAAKQVGKLGEADAKRAKDAFDQYLALHSPNYAKFQAAKNSYGLDLESRQALADALHTMTNVANSAGGRPNVTFVGARNALGKTNLTGAAQDYATNLLDDLQRSTTQNAPVGAAGSQTFANAEAGAGGGLLGKLMHGATHGLGTTALVASGHIGTGILAGVVGKATSIASAKTEKAAIDLLLNPKKLANALEQFKDAPKAKDAFIKALKGKASGAGKAGTRAIQAYNARSNP